MKLQHISMQNFKRIIALDLDVSDGVTTIGGANGSGKSSALQAVAAILGGRAQCPELPVRIGADKAEVTMTLDGLKARWTQTADNRPSLTVTGADGTKLSSPQAVMDKLTGNGACCFDPLAFAELEPKEQADRLRELVGLDLSEIDARAAVAYQQRTLIGRDMLIARSQLAGMPTIGTAVPDEEVSIAALTQQLQAAHATNREADDRVRAYDALCQHSERMSAEVDRLKGVLLLIEQNLIAAKKNLADAELKLLTNERPLLDAVLARDRAPRIDPAPIQSAILNAETTNRAVRQKLSRQEKIREAAALEAEQTRLTRAIDDAAQERRAAIAACKFPVPGLEISPQSVVTLNGIPFGNLSTSEQIRVSAAIGMASNPDLRLMLIHRGESLDKQNREALKALAREKDFQILMEVVGDDAEASVVIEDGRALEF